MRTVRSVVIAACHGGAGASALLRNLEPILDEIRRQRLQRLDPWRSNNRSVQEQADFKTALLEFFQCDAGTDATRPTAKCMVSGEVFPRPVVIASHIWKHCTGGVGLEEFGLREIDIHSPRNGLLMAPEIEAAFDTKRVSFSFDLLTDAFTFRVLDDTLLDKRILNLNDKKTENAISGYEMLPESIPTFKELDKTRMEWSPNACPFRRLLAWHYAMATLHATRFSKTPRAATQHHGLKTFDDVEKLREHSPSASWPCREVLDLFDHAVSKSERDVAELADQQTPTATATDDESASGT